MNGGMGAAAGLGGAPMGNGQRQSRLMGMTQAEFEALELQ